MRLAALHLVVLWLGLSAANATVRIVNAYDDDASGPCTTHCTLRGAIGIAVDGDTILFSPDVFNVPREVLLSSELILNKNLTIIGTGADKLTVRRSSVSFFRLLRILNTTSVSIEGLRLSSGWARLDALNGWGGAIYNAGSLTLNKVEISSNTSEEGGAGLFNGGTAIITNSTIDNNFAETAHGGGIYNTGTLTAINITITGNIASGSMSFGGGVYRSAGTVTLYNATLATNSAGQGGGIFGGATVGNSIIANNTAQSGNDFFGTVTSSGFNLIRSFSGTISGGGAITGVDPLLDPAGLINNGGTVRTIALQLTSPALDGGSSAIAGSSTDQRGLTRPFDFPGTPNSGDGADIGAFEAQAIASRISGKVMRSNSVATSHAFVTLINNSTGASRLVLTNGSGFYNFLNVATGQSYTLTVQAKTTAYLPRTLTINGPRLDLNFTAMQ
jgi:hypothetical protein